jgi:DNA polymerase III delta subunit
MRSGDYSGSKSGGDAKKSDKPDKEGEREKEKRNGFKALLSAVEEYGLSVEFQSEKGDKLCQWVERHFASRHVQITRNLSSFLVSYCGSDMYTLQGEIHKLCDAYTGTPLTEQDVKTYCCANESHVFFDVASCMVRGDLAGARKILSSLRMTPDDVPMAMGFLASNYRLMALVKAGMDQGKTSNQIAAEHKLGSWKVSRVISSLQNVDSVSLHRAIADIAEADIRMKTRRGDSVSVLEVLVYRICTYGR